ncbi:MAG: hypothetical protein F6K24_24880 [Okeania sp. SIO2D1]|nr:hypothetical protein [Okeania sp. SIO2D1]
MAQYNDRQQIFCLSMISAVCGLNFTTGSQPELQEIATKRTQAVLSDPDQQKLI